MRDLSPAQREVALWAVDLFAAAGLDLPPIELVAHDGDAACHHRYDGLHRHVDGRSVIDLCGRFDRHLAEPLYLHELAHAWAAHSLTVERRVAFLALRGAAAWNDDALDWHERGTEQAAEIIVWGLRDRPMRVARIQGSSCAELLAGYRVLTGADPLHGFTDHCGPAEDPSVP
jgi:hypothetical protein